tara:strand:- start:184 stop:453 length:270 start_codon:yes stop_codon:yes gene_type:complete
MSAITVSIDILSLNAVELNINKKINIGVKAWHLFRKSYVKDLINLEVNGRVKTSMAAIEWKKLSNDDKKKWYDGAANPTECGNRWVNYI